MTRPPGRTTRAASASVEIGIGDQLEHPDEEGRVDRRVSEGQPIDVCHRHAGTDAFDGGAHHRVAQVDADDVQAMVAEAVGDHAGADAQFDDALAVDPRSEVVGEVVAAALAAACLVVDGGDSIERRSGHGTAP